MCECKGALASIGSVATDVIERLMSEFHSGDFYMAYSAFDLDQWESASVPSNTGMAPAPDMEWLRGKLAAAARRFCKGVGVLYDSEGWRRGARAALEERRRMRACASTPVGPEAEGNIGKPPHVDNRAAWRAVLDAGRAPSLAGALRFYLATWDGTGQVERGLGLDAHIVKRHLGSHQTSSGGDDLYSGLLELKLDGPQREEDVFTRGDAGLLYLTDFSRACASLWLLRHGRRFTCSQSERKDKGCRQQKRTFEHTDLAVQMRARSAHDVLDTIAQADEAPRASPPGAQPPRPTIFRGVDRANLMASVNRCPQPEAQKKTLLFRKNTHLKAKAKRKETVWAGLTGSETKLRLGGTVAIAARSRTSAVQAAGAVLWRGRAARVRQADSRAGGASSGQKPAADLAAGAQAKPPKRLRASTPEVVDADRKPCPSYPKTPDAAAPGILAKRTLDDMFRRKMSDPSTQDLLAWMTAIFQGGSVSCKGKTFNMEPARRVPTTISLDKSFSSKHTVLSKALTAVTADKNSQWRVTRPDDRTRSARTISKKRDMVEWLLSVRRAGVPVAA